MKRKHQRLLASTMAAVMVTSMAPLASASRLNELKYAPDKGITDTINYVGQLDSLKRVLFVGAHPDDETNSLLVYLNRKEGADAIYTTINWGEGGDNSIGNELYGALGVLRSQELNSARMFDHAEQMYAGAVDFGYSVSLKESLLGDPETNSDGIYSIDALGYNLAKIIRTTRPQVMFSNHKAPNTDHGQHRAVGWLIEYAIDLAADASYTIYDEDGSPLAAWQVQKFFSTTPNQRLIDTYKDEFTAVGEKSSVNPLQSDLVIDLGEYDPVLGMSYDEWGVLGRNMHKCQKMIGTPSKGESNRNYILQKAAPGADVSDDFSSTIFGGLDVVDIEDWDPLSTGSTAYVELDDQLDVPEEIVETSVEESETPVEESETPAEESETPAEESETPAEESETPAEESETPAEESETPAEESETPAEESETPAEESETPAEESVALAEEPVALAEEFDSPADALDTLVNNVNEFQDKFSQKNVTANAGLLTEALAALDEIEATI
ncbi:MAG: PIG-L family deacetylase, partial [Butyricicoccus sp.]|nr:PIG-L family deacetylase [Butyricicoccus sp.]